MNTNAPSRRGELEAGVAGQAGARFVGLLFQNDNDLHGAKRRSSPLKAAGNIWCRQRAIAVIKRQGPVLPGAYRP